MAMDVQDPISVMHVIDRANELRPLDVIINAAGVNHDALLIRAQHQQVMDMINTNIVGTINVNKAAALILLRARRKGSIIHIGSAAALKTTKGNAVYAASKAAIHSLVRSMALEMSGKEIRCNAIAPGFVATSMTQHLDQAVLTKMTPLGRLCDLNDIGQAVEYLIKNDIVTGQILALDGGLSL
jgi:NAD(P)-dependent dehydrogenase (short-subunit alcohol dehydrogenase family)